MFRNLLVVVFMGACLLGYAQVPDTLQGSLPFDSLLNQKLQTLDSLQRQTEKQFTLLKLEYDSVEQAYTSLAASLQQQVDSLNLVQGQTEKLIAKIDSINSLKEEKLWGVRTKAEKLKQASVNKIESLGLPPELQDKVDEYAGALGQLEMSLPKTEFSFPSLQLEGMPALSLPGIKSPLPPGMGELSIAHVAEEVNEVTQALKNLEGGIPEMPTLEDVAARVESKAEEIATEKFGELSGIPEVPTDGETAREAMLDEAKKQVLNHFAGKEDQLKTAMEQVSKYKQQFSSVQSIKDLPKKAPNPMKDKPLKERLVPGLTLQVQRRNDWWFDFNPYLGYRFNGRVTAGLGWDHRLAYNSDLGQFNSISRVYGPRAYGEYRLNKGILPRLELEYLNTPVRIPPDFKYTHREWVWSAMAGMKKEYRISKSLKGNAQVLYNLFNPEHRSPYLDRLNVRMGVEYSTRKPGRKL